MDPHIPVPVTAPQRDFCKQERLSLGRLTKLFEAGEVESVVIGGRFRHVIIASYIDYVARQLRGEQRDLEERELAKRRYRASVSPQATAAAARALAGKPKPGRPRGSGGGARSSGNSTNKQVN
jgi:hypothetical protein